MYWSIVDFLRSTGLSESDMNMFGSYEIGAFTVCKLGNFSPENNNVNISLGTIKEYFKESDIPEKIAILEVVIHELAHGVSMNKYLIPPDEEGRGLKEIHSGYFISKEEKRPGGLYENGFNGLNEGVTERYAREVLREYVRRTGEYSKEDMDIAEKVLASEKGHPYSANVRFMDILIKEISQSAGVSEETVWESIKAGYFRGEGFLDPELREEMEGLFDEQFTEDLKKGNFSNIIKRIDDAKSSDDTEKNAFTRLASLFGARVKGLFGTGANKSD